VKPKVRLTIKQQIEHWAQLYTQAKTEGDSKKAKLYEALIIKLKGRVPK